MMPLEEEPIQRIGTTRALSEATGSPIVESCVVGADSDEEGSPIPPHPKQRKTDARSRKIQSNREVPRPLSSAALFTRIVIGTRIVSHQS